MAENIYDWNTDVRNLASIKKCSYWDTFFSSFLRTGLLKSIGTTGRIPGLKRWFTSPILLTRRTWSAHCNFRQQFVIHRKRTRCYCAELANVKGKPFCLTERFAALGRIQNTFSKLELPENHISQADKHWR